MKLCCFRFDIDTHACVTRGMPRLLELAERLEVPFTFFFHMGRAFDPRITAAKMWRRLFWRRPGGVMSVAGKLGLWETLRAVFLNPRVGWSDPTMLRAAVRAGHEIGLHGGRNHARWERDAHLWPEERLCEEVETSLRWLWECGGEDVLAFASPAWNSPTGLPGVLRKLGFRVFADVYGPTREDVPVVDSLWSMPTNVIAGPGRAGYLETMCRNGRSTRETIEHFRAQLAAKTRLAVVYDHPFFAGTHAVDLLGDLVNVAREEGYDICTVSEAAQVLHGRSAPAVPARA